MVTGELRKDIDALWTEFWTGGITNPLTVIEQITFLMYARLLDINEARDENREKWTGKSFKRRFNENEQHLRWSQFRHLGAERMLPVVRDEVFLHFRSTVASGTSFAEFMKDAQLMIQKPALLVKAVSMIHELPLTEGDTKGDLYEYLLGKLTTAGINGQFRTPRHIIRLMVDVLEPEPTDVIGDPSCGTGGFLISVMDYLLERFTSPAGIIEETDPVTGVVEKIYTGDLLEEHREHIRRRMFYGFDFDTTMRHIIRLMVDVLEPEPTDVIGDPSCGTGGFLISVMDYLLERFTSPAGIIEETDPVTGVVEKIYTGDLLEEHREHIRRRMFYGFDFDTTMLRIAAMNLILHGVDDPGIRYQDTLSSGFTDRYPGQSSDGFDVILANPPFKGSLDFEDVHSGLLRKVKTKKTELLFVALIMRMLKTGGRSSMIVPDGVLFGSTTAHLQLRKLLVDENQLEAVISLPSGVFKPYAGVSTGILVFTKGGRTDNVFFYDVQADGRSLDDKRELVAENDLPDCLARWRSRDPARDTDRTEKAYFVPAEEIRAAGYNLSVNRYNETEYHEEEYEPPQVILMRMRALNDDIGADLGQLEEMLG